MMTDASAMCAVALWHSQTSNATFTAQPTAQSERNSCRVVIDCREPKPAA